MEDSGWRGGLAPSSICFLPSSFSLLRALRGSNRLRGPPEAALHDGQVGFRFDDGGGVAEGVVEDAALTIELGPEDGHVDGAIGRVGAGGNGEASRREDFHGGVDVQVVLFALDGEVVDAGG